MSFVDGIINFFNNLKNEPVPKLEAIRRQCKKEGKLFEDREFPVKNSLLPENLQSRNIVWLRPKDISKRPMLLDETVRYYSTRFTFLAALQAIRSNRRAFNKIINVKQNVQDMRSKQYVGAISFMFWQYGYWKEVIIDDRIPTLNGDVCFFESLELNEFWPPLVMKAYAKLGNNYDIFEKISFKEALTDLTGGLIESISLSKFEEPREIYSYFCGKLNENATITFTTEAKKNGTKHGLVAGNTYVLKRSNIVEKITGEIKLLFCIQNPWVNSSRWTGHWGIDSSLWKNIENRTMYLNSLVGSEFFMSVEEIQECFELSAICHNITHFDATKYQYLSFDGQWIKDFNSGGGPNLSSFYTNPQYRVKVRANSDDDEENFGSMLVSLMRKPSKSNEKKIPQLSLLMFLVLEPYNKHNTLTNTFFSNPAHHITTKLSFSRSREMVMRFNVVEGEYCIVPFLKDEDAELGFHLRIFAECLIEEQSSFKEYNLYASNKDEGGESVEDLKCKIKSVYDRIANDEGLVNVSDTYKLLEILASPEEERLNRDKCWSMLRLFDERKMGNLNFDEFTNLLFFYRQCHNAFSNLSDKHSKTLKLYGAKLYFKTLGYDLSDKNFSLIFNRYANQHNELVFPDLLYATTKIEIGLKTGSKNSRIVDLVLSV